MSNLEFCLNFRALILLAARSSFANIAAEEVLRLLEEAAEKIGNAITAQALKNGTVTGSDIRQIGTMLLKVWELSRREYLKDQVTGKKWEMAMAVSNASYEMLFNDAKTAMNHSEVTL